MGLRYRHIYMNSNQIWSEDKGQTTMIENPTWKQYTDEGWECPEGWRVFQISQDGKTIILESTGSLGYREPEQITAIDSPTAVPTSVLCGQIDALTIALHEIYTMGPDPIPGKTMLVAKKALGIKK